MKQVNFINIENDRIKDIFLPVFERYDFPRKATVALQGVDLKGSTMDARPAMTLRNFLAGVDTYRIRFSEFVRDSRQLKTTDLSDDILTGWFAHELGHIVDYMSRSATGMITFGLKYSFSESFRRKAEYRADEIAIRQGFHEYILRTKEFLFYHEHIDQKYRDKLMRYYMSMEDTHALIEEVVTIDPV